MSVWRRLRAGMLVATVFGLFWGLMVTVTQIVAIVFTEGVGVLSSYWATIPFAIGIYTVLGALQGLLLSTGLMVTGRGDGSVDTLPPWRGASLGAVVGLVGYAVLWSFERGSPPAASVWQVIPWVDFGLGALIGAVATGTILTIARRGALPAAPADPRQLGS